MDRFLTHRFKKGDHDAFKELYNTNCDRAFRLAKAITKNEDMTKDVVQISFIRAYEYRNAYNPNKQFSFWFNRILVNECKRALGNKDQSVILMSDYSTAIQSTKDNYKFEKYELLYEALQNLSDNLRIPLLLKYINGFTEMDIANILNLKRSTVKSRLYEGRKKIKRLLEQKGYKEYSYE